MLFRKRGYITVEELRSLVPLPPLERIKASAVAVAECVEDIPCNVCMSACPTNAITVEGMRGMPKIGWDNCVGCGICVGICPGQAIFLVDLKGESAKVTVPYEFLPKVKKGMKVDLLNRAGEKVGEGEVVGFFEVNKTQVVTVEVPVELIWEVRSIWVKE